MTKKKNHTCRTVTLSIVFIILLGLAVAAIWQADNIKALVYMKKYTPEQRAELKKQNDDAIQNIINSVPEVSGLNPLDEEQEKQLHNGQISDEEALKIIMGEAISNDNSEAGPSSDNQTAGQTDGKSSNEKTQDKNPASENRSSSGGQGSSAQQQPDTEKTEETPQLKKLFARIYLLRSNFTGRLNSLINEAKDEVNSPAAEGNVLGIANKYYNLGTALESECDGKMEELLSQIKEEIIRSGGDTGVVEQIRSAYQNEKSLSKSALMDKYYNR